jgi:putative glutamine amidotransferase
VISIKKAIIGILANLLITEGGTVPANERTYVNHEYVHAIIKAGGLPLLLPVVGDKQDIEQQIEQVDGVLLTGGYDINPLQYGEEPRKELGGIFPEVDEHQLTAVRIAAKLEKPMLGICRGLQVLNVAFGGTLYQDISQLPNCGIKHFQQAQRYVPSHTVEIIPNTRLAQLFESQTIVTNSFHHQSVKVVAPELIVSARTRDGVVESLEKTAGYFILAVQWHPEMMIDRYPAMLTVFQELVRAAEASRGEKL